MSRRAARRPNSIGFLHLVGCLHEPRAAIIGRKMIQEEEIIEKEKKMYNWNNPLPAQSHLTRNGQLNAHEVD